MNHYDKMAADYDFLYADPRYRAEDEAVANALRPHLTGSVLDVGCGTGLLLEYAADTITHYMGIDPSTGMLARMLQKHPTARVMQSAFEDFTVSSRVDLLVSLFGAASYVRPTHYEGLRDSGTDYFIMFYRPGYAPEYDPADVLKTDYGRIKHVFGGMKQAWSGVYDWHDFRVATSLGVRLT